MPTYHYKCSESNCKYEFEKVQKISDTPLCQCPKCQKNTLKKVPVTNAFRLKGSGWFKDGYSKVNS